MRKNCGIFVGMSNEAIKKVIEAISFRAYAEETDPSGADDNNDGGSSSGGTTINYEDLIAKARKEEKEKQYKTIEKLKGQIDALTQQHNTDLLVVADLKEKLKSAEDKLTTAGSGDSEELKTLKAEVETLKKDKATLEQDLEKAKSTPPVSREDVEKDVRAELEKEYEVKTYKAEKMAELKDDILVPELVFGSTKEEIDASIKSAMERSNSIREQLGIKGGKKTPTTPRTPKSPSNPSVNRVQDKEISMEYLVSLDVRSPEYAEVRKQLGLK